MENFKNKFLTINNKKIEVVRFIGSGNLGGVWEIKNELGYPKALKVLYNLDPTDTANFLAKLDILKKIDHPNIMKIEKIALLSVHNLQSLLDETKLPHKNKEVPCFIMPYASINLADYIVLHKENLLERVKLALQLCAAIKKIHHLKIYNDQQKLENLRHNNITFNNILLVNKNNSYLLKVADLGIDTALGVGEKLSTSTLLQIFDDHQQLQKILIELFDKEEFQKVIRGLPDITEKTLGQWYENLRQWDKRLRDQKRALSHLHLGIQLYTKEMYNYAQKDLEKAISIQPDLYEAHLFLGHILRDIGQQEQAHKYYEKTLELNPQEPRVYEGRGELFLEQDNTDAAISDFKKALELDGTRSFCYATLGSIYKEKEAYSKAINCFSNLLELENDCTWGYVDRGDAHFALENYTKAQSDYKAALGLENENEEIKAKYALATEKQTKKLT